MYSFASGFAASPVLSEGSGEMEGEARDEFAGTSIPIGEFCDKLGPIGTVKEIVKVAKTLRMPNTYKVRCICSGSNHDIPRLYLLLSAKASAGHSFFYRSSATGIQVMPQRYLKLVVANMSADHSIWRSCAVRAQDTIPFTSRVDRRSCEPFWGWWY